MPAAKSNTPTFLAEFLDYAVANVETPYDQLMAKAAADGWRYRLEEVEILDGADAPIVRFQVWAGHAEKGDLEPFDKLTVKVGHGPGPISLAARIIAANALPYLFFGRTPPVAQQAAPVPAQQTVRMDDTDIVLPGEDPLPEGPDEPEQEYVPDTAPVSRRAAAQAAKLPSLIDHVEPDGVPVFVDLDNVPEDFSTDDIIDQVIVDVDRAAVKLTSVEQLVALFSKNADAIGVQDSFLSELGTPEQRTRLKDLLDKHQARIEANATTREVKIPAGKPRRRRG